MPRLLPDLALAVRRLSRAPGFATIAILTLALGIGANTAIFSLVQTVLLRPLPYGDPGRLVMIWGSRLKGETTWISGPEILDYARDTSVFAQVAAYTSTSSNLTGGQEPERVLTAVVTPNLFTTLGVRPLTGRTFSLTDSAYTMQDQVVLSFGLWQRRFGGRTDLVGQSIQINGNARTVIGVMPHSFKLPRDFSNDRPSELWVPLDLNAESWQSWGDHSLLGVARLRDGVTPGAASASMRIVEERWIRDGHWSNRGLGGRTALELDQLVLGDMRSALWILLGAVLVILLIACANVANLLLARSDDRHREIAVRTALGASRGRIVRQLLSESALLALVGGAIGVALAHAGLRLLVAANPADIPRVEEAALNPIVLLFSVLLSVLTGLIFGLAPALQLSRPDLSRALKEGGRTGSAGPAAQRYRDALAVAQMAFSVVLLVGAVLLVRSFIALRRVDLGFTRDQVLTVRTTLPQSSYADDAAVIGFVRTLRQRLTELPGVRAAGATRLLPLTGTIGDWSITLEGRPRLPGENPNGDWQVVTPGYFETMGVKLERGRFFTDADREHAPIVAVVNRTMARRYWPNEDAIGKRFHLGTQERPWITIVGIVGEVRHNAVTETARAEMYVPHAQWTSAGASAPRGMTFVLRTAGDPLAALAYVRQLVRSMDPNLPLSDVRSLARVADDSVAQARFTTLLLSLFAALALSLATLGIYGVISLLVRRRQQEIGIRVALGAQRASIVGMVLRRGMALAVIGVVLGLLGAVMLTGVLENMLYGVTPFDATSFTVVPVLLVTVALMASLIPAGRAASVDPVIALREE
jgi:putative ABC transport system permease protein